MKEVGIIIKRMFLNLFALSGMFWSTSFLSNIPQDITNERVADSSYKKLDEMLRFDARKNVFTYFSEKDSTIFDEMAREINYCNYRNEGIKIWKKFPKDTRRFKWFRNTWLYSTWYNRYWGNIENGAKAFVERPTRSSQYSTSIDWKSLREWEKLYPAMLNEYRIHCQNEDSMKEYEEVLTLILNAFLKLSLNKEYRDCQKMSLVKLKKYFLPAAERILNYNMRDQQDRIRTLANLNNVMNMEFISVYQEYGLNKHDMKWFFYSLRDHPSFGIREWALKGMSLFLLMDSSSSFQFSHKDIDGAEINFQKMRGQVVLIDFWATWCSTCIERMPAIKKVYDKYKNRNFTVLSACLSDETALPRVNDIKNKIGADWSTLLIGSSANENSLGQTIWRKYNFWGVPQLLLFNKKGKLVLINDVLRSGDFEPVVKKLIEE